MNSPLCVCVCVACSLLDVDPDYRWLELGKLSAIREMQWTRLAQQYIPNLKYISLCSYVPGECFSSKLHSCSFDLL